MHGRATIPGFRVLRPLGQGGMGSVLLVEPAGLPGVQRALKLLTVSDPERRARFLREAALMARVDRCPGVVRVHDAGEHEGLLWLCMEFVEGRDLGRALAEGGPLPWPEVVRLGRDLALGLAEVHARGVVHRDVKPQNVVVDAAGAAFLVDFGVAQATDLERLTLTGMAMGTPAYFSPEQTSGRQVDGKSDVYSLGITLFELLTGEVPFPDDVALGALVQAILHERPRPPSARRPEVPAALDRVVLTALEKDPARRPSAGELAAMLDEVLRRPRGATTGERVARLAARPGARRGALVALVAAPVAALWFAALRLPPAPLADDAAARASLPSAPSTSTVDPAPLRELEALLERGEALRAVGWLNARRDATGGERRALAAAAPAVEPRARERAITALALGGTPEDEVVALLTVVGRLRELAPAADPGADLAHVVVERVRDQARAARVGRIAVAELRPALRLLEACAEARVRATDLALGSAAADALLDVRIERHLDDVDYVPALLALVDLDVGLEHGHLLRVRVVPDERARPAAELLRLRLDLALSLEAAVAGDTRRRRIHAFVTSERGRALGPVTRSRALCLCLHRQLPPDEAVALAHEACQLDPSSPFARLALARALLLRDGDRAALAAGRELDLARARFDDLPRPGRKAPAWEQIPFLRAAVTLYARAKRDDDAAALIARARALPEVLPEWVEDLERLRQTARDELPPNQDY